MIRSMILTGAMVCALFADPVRAAPQAREDDCGLAQRYHALAREQLREYNEDDAARYLERAAEVCPRYTYAQELGELKSGLGEDRQKQEAVDAFLEAHRLASTDAERARTLWKYATLLNDEGDPQNAYPLVLEAKRLDGSNADILALTTEIQNRVENPTREQLVRGLSDSLYKPIVIKAALDAASGPVGGGSTDPSAAPGFAAAPAGATDSGARTFVPIHFEFDSTRVDEKTAQNIDVLASALVDDRLSGSAFVFVGHADVRGIEEYNLVLSKRRADAIYDAVVDLEPRLAGRISVSGRGESEPIDSGSTDEAHWRNRRLQILVQ